MCGILGLIDPRGIDPALGPQLGALIRHRGPDDEGYLLCSQDAVEPIAGPDTPVASCRSGLAYAPAGATPAHVSAPRLLLGHRRLSIVDLSPAGHQPMTIDGRYWITYNGEVYNHVELRQELAGLGHRFHSGSDTEVILAAYAQWGPDCLARFNGMWGMAILDRVARTLFIARDRFGVKPVYYTCRDGRFAFASEIKALLPVMTGSPKVNLPRLMDFLVWNVSDHGSETMFDGVHQLPAGHHLTLDVGPALEGQAGIAHSAIVPRRWYTIAPRGAPSVGEPAEALGVALRAAVDLRLRADVPVGSCLSGGLDSSAIVCTMSRLLRERGSSAGQKTFTACSDVAAFDESRYAWAVAEAAGTEATFLTPTAKELLDHLDRIVWHQDEPFISTSIFAQWKVFRAARDAGVIVMLDGQGADESLGGYRGFFGAHLAALASAGRLGSWLGEAAAIRREAGFGWPRLVGYTLAYLRPEWIEWVGKLDGRAYASQDWVQPTHRGAFAVDPLRHLGARAISIQAMSIAQLAATNLPMLLRWEDRNSMAASVEARVPFLDYRLVELALALPNEAKVGRGIAKRALRQAMRGRVPDLVLDRKDKMGFVTSEAQWLLHDEGQAATALLEASLATLGDLVSAAPIRRDWAAMRQGQQRYDHRMWRVMVAGRWMSRFGLALP